MYFTEKNLYVVGKLNPINETDLITRRRCPPLLQVAGSISRTGGEHISCLVAARQRKENFLHSKIFSDAAIRDSIGFNVPKDYLAFMGKYGFGNINDLICFYEPDNEYVRNHYIDNMDFWDWENEAQKNMALNSLFISNTADGDIICCVNNGDFPYLFLPRDDETPSFYKHIDDLLSFCLGDIDKDDLYFDSHYQSKREDISLIKDGKLDKSLVYKIQSSFLGRYKVDKIIDKDTQPKYITQGIGGWVNFDLIYENGIYIKYQLMYERKANEIIDFIKNEVRPNII